MAAAGSCTITQTAKNSHSGVSRVKFAWTSDASGNVSGGAGLTAFSVYGKIARIVTNPGGGSPPTANYDIVLNDEDVADVLVGVAANRHTTTSESITQAAPITIDGTLEIVVSAAGNETSGTLTLYLV